jgi:hypothetical protein
MKKNFGQGSYRKVEGKRMAIPFDQLVRTFDSERLGKAYQSLIDKEVRESEPSRKQTLERRISVIKMELRERYERKRLLARRRRACSLRWATESAKPRACARNFAENF